MHLLTRTPAEVEFCMEIIGANLCINFLKIVNMVPETISPLVGMRKSQTKLKISFVQHAPESLGLYA